MTYDEQLKYILSVVKRYNNEKIKYGVVFYFDLKQLEENGADVDIIKENIGSDVDKVIIGVVPTSSNDISEDTINMFYRILKERMGYFVYASEYKVMDINRVIELLEKEIEDIENGY
jgi:hypothetical protein